MIQKIFACFFLGTLALQGNYDLQAQTPSTTIIKRPLTVESIWKNREFPVEGFPGFNGMKDGEHFSRFNMSENGFSITKHAYNNYAGEGEIILTDKDLVLKNETLEINDYAFNADETKLLLTTKAEAVYRRSYTATFYIYDLKSKKITALDEKRNRTTLAEFSPDGNQIAYISENNLYVKDLISGKVTQITKDGEHNKIINGTTDWVYEEEFAITKGFGWSPDSKQIAFLRFDESKVKEFEIEYYGNLYPDIYKFKYPKAGEDNSKVTAHIYSLKSAATSKLNLGEYEYIPRIQWSGTNNQLVIQTLNRHQNHVKYHLMDLTQKTLTQKIIFEEKSKTYIDIDDNLLILKDGKSILRTSDASGFTHIYKVGFDGSNRQITKGNWDVIEFLGIDEDIDVIYYSAAEKGAIYQGIYRIKTDGTSKMPISEETGYSDASFAMGMKYFVKSYSTGNTPNVITLCKADGYEMGILEDNEKLKSYLGNFDISPKEFITVQGATGPLNAWIIKPSNFDPNKKYPVYMNIYGGPGGNTVKDEFEGNNYMYHQLLAQQGYIVFSVDPRGAMYSGEAFKKSTYLQLGKLETEDFIAVAKELGKLSYIDKNRIGIQGWSYGGYMTSLAMTKGGDIFKMGIAVAPVTNWRYYDNIYTERFMRTPQENASGYDDNSPINFVSQIKGKYFIIHGDADDNVHCQNTMEMITAMTKANIQFDMFIYPNKNHGIYGGNTRNHLFNMMLNYTLKNL